MSRRKAALLATLGLLLAACGNLGVGDQSCETSARGASAANVLTVQAVPTARYTPCFSSLDLGWDDVDFEAESGRAGIAVQRDSVTFLTAIVTASCDIGDARPVESRHIDIRRYEDIESIPVDITVTIIPTGNREVANAEAVARTWAGAEFDERLVVFAVDTATEEPIAERIDRALSADHFVWVIDELDAAEDTVEMRTPGGLALPQTRPQDALERIEDLAPEPFYRGQWFFTFEGGCITYTFDTKGQLSGTVAADATANLGFYPGYQLWDIAFEESREGRE